MDPVTAYSLFCNIITTVDGAVRIAHTLKELYVSPSGLTRQAERLRHESAHLAAIVDELSACQVQLSSLPQHSLLIKVAESCTEVSNKMQLLLGRIRVNSQGRQSVAVVKAWAKSRAAKFELQELEIELQLSSNRLRTAMTLATRADIISLRHSLSSLNKSQSCVIERLSTISEEVSKCNDIFLDMSRLAAVFKEAQDSIDHATIIRSLNPLSAQGREGEISRHHKSTFQWIFKPEPEHQERDRDAPTSASAAHFIHWLKEGSGVFHFTGKPGSGKSTLFKFLANNQEVHRNLQEWATAAGKSLIISKFFFWKHGPNDRTTVPGLLRGLLYEICVENPIITKLLFPSLWGNDGSEKELRVKDDEVRAAFDRLCTNKDIHREFRMCFFIDGLDEFDGKEMAHWKLAKTLQNWTEPVPGSPGADSFLKLCLSSREEHSISSVFQSPCHIRLQDMTKRDISAMVNDTLLSNEYFQQLQQKDAAGSQELINSILQGADGVFLWVSLLINLLEDELPCVSSVAALQNIVRTTPPQLEDFISKIVNDIRKHHRRGAYFILSMALRMIGVHLSDDGKFPAAEQDEYQKIFDGEWNWRPYLPTYGLLAVMEFLETGDSWHKYPVKFEERSDQEFEARSQAAIVKIRTWSRGLLDIFSVDQRDVDDTFVKEFRGVHREPKPSESDSDSGRKFAFVKFTHWSIPTFLMSVIQDRVTGHGFGDDDIMKGIIAVLIEETNATYNDTPPQAFNSSFYLQHVLRLIRLRKISESDSIFPMLDQLEYARFQAYSRTSCSPHSDLQSCASGFNAICGSQQEFELKSYYNNSWGAYHEAFLFWRKSVTVWAHASHAGLDEYLRWKLKRDHNVASNPFLLFSALGGLSTYHSFYWGSFPLRYTSTLRLLLSSNCPIDVPIPFSQESTAELPPSEGIIQISNAPGLTVREKPIELKQRLGDCGNFAGWAWLVVLPSILHTLIFLGHKAQSVAAAWDYLETWLEFGAMPPMDIVFAEVEGSSNTGQVPEKKVSVRYKVFVSSEYRDEVHRIKSGFCGDALSGGKILSQLANQEGTSLEALLRFHSPPNAASILGYIDRNLRQVHSEPGK